MNVIKDLTIYGDNETHIEVYKNVHNEISISMCDDGSDGDAVTIFLDTEYATILRDELTKLIEQLSAE